MGRNWPLISCTRRCIPSSMHTSRPSPNPKALLGRGVSAASPDRPQRERRRIKQTSAPDHHLHLNTFHSGTFLRWGGGGLYLTRLFKRIRQHLQMPTKFPRDPTMHAKDNWAMTHFRISICSLPNGSIFMYVSTVTTINLQRFKEAQSQAWGFYIVASSETFKMSVWLMWTCANMIKKKHFEFTCSNS